jgi:hypothetical protein
VRSVAQQDTPGVPRRCEKETACCCRACHPFRREKCCPLWGYSCACVDTLRRLPERTDRRVGRGKKEELRTDCQSCVGERITSAEGSRLRPGSFRARSLLAPVAVVPPRDGCLRKGCPVSWFPPASRRRNPFSHGCREGARPIGKRLHAKARLPGNPRVENRRTNRVRTAEIGSGDGRHFA